VDHSEADVMQSSMLQSTGRSEQQQAQSQDREADTEAVQHKTVVALKGQLLHWRLLVANSGQLCLITADITALYIAYSQILWCAKLWPSDVVGSRALGCSTMCSLLFDWRGTFVIILACLLNSL